MPSLRKIVVRLCVCVCVGRSLIPPPQGILSILSFKTGRWTQGYFVLSKDRLYYFKKEVVRPLKRQFLL